MSNSKKQKDQSDLVNEKVEVSPVSESDAAASKEEDPFHTAVESITSSPVTSEKEAEEYVSNQTFAAANEHEMQALISILEGEAPADRKAILKALVQREKLKEGAGKKTDVNENELNEDWKHGGYPYKNRMSRKIYEKEKYLLQVELHPVRRPRCCRKGRNHPSLYGTSQSSRSPRGCLGKTDPARARRMVLPALRKTPAHRR